VKTLSIADSERLGRDHARQTVGHCPPGPTDPGPRTKSPRLGAGPQLPVGVASRAERGPRGEADPSDAHKAHVLASADDDDFDFPVAQRLADEGGFDLGEAVDQASLLVLERWPSIEAVARALRGSRRGLVSGGRDRGPQPGQAPGSFLRPASPAGSSNPARAFASLIAASLRGW
jgi:hypothetical protein